MKEFNYSTWQFRWNKEHNCFYGDAPYLEEGSGYYQYAFPNGKKQFNMTNPKTGGFRRFRFVKDDILNDEPIWVFESEDGIQCKISLMP